MNTNTSRNDRRFGLTREEWLKLYEDAGWRKEVSETLRTIVNCPHARPIDRDRAMVIWCHMAEIGIAETEDTRSIPEVIRDMQLSIARGRQGLVLDEKLRQEMTERLDGAMLTAATITPLLGHELLAVMAEASHSHPLADRGN